VIETRRPLVLVVDDEENVRFLLASALRHFDFEVALAPNGRDGLALVDVARPDLVLLDVALPDLDGFEVCRRLRADGIDVPVVFLTARDAVDDRVRGLSAGGDDYVTKPFSFDEVIARMRAILRRRGALRESALITFGDLELDDDAHAVMRAAVPIDLSPTEYNLLRFLLRNAGRVLTREQILQAVWELDFDGKATVVDTYISYLRKKLDAIGPPLVHTVRGVGYVVRATG
jgi:two-component system OmpR family response regulator